jgi:cytochrome b subunit of formate dehydrogenase
MMLVFVVSFHVIFHSLRREYDLFPKKGDLKESYHIIKAMVTGGKEPPSEKYLAEQRLAYFFIGANVLLLIVTGIVKVLKNLEGVSLPYSIVALSTHLHNLGTVLLVLGIIGHLAAFIFKANRPLIRGMFVGTVDEAYAKERHSLWYERIRSQEIHKSLKQRTENQNRSVDA